MKVLIQNPESRKFLARRGGWDDTVINARDFRTPVKAIAFAKDTGMEDFRVVLHFPDNNGSTGLMLGATPGGAQFDRSRGSLHGR
jgi:hypothetical protein